MFIAKQLKKKNITGYLLYMWQIEDLIRACQLNIDEINRKVIEPYQLGDEEKKMLYEWYESLIDMMKAENVQEKGHIQLNKNIIILLDDFHNEFMKSGKDASYNAAFYRILPALGQLRQKQPDENISDIELCFGFLYGIVMLRLQKKEISRSTLETQVKTSEFLELLSRYYQLYVAGELSFDD